MKKIWKKATAAALSLALMAGAVPASLCITANADTSTVYFEGNPTESWWGEEGDIMLPGSIIDGSDTFGCTFESPYDSETFVGTYYFKDFYQENDIWIAEFFEIIFDLESMEYRYSDWNGTFTLAFPIPADHENDTPIGICCENYEKNEFQTDPDEYDSWEDYHTWSFSLAYDEPLKADFDANGGTGTMDPITVNEEGYYVLPDCTFTPPEGKVFDYWDCDGLFNPGDSVYPSENHTYTAIWKDKEVAFISNSMTLGGAISLNFYVDFANVPDEYLDDAYVDFYVNGGTQEVPLNRNKMNSKKTAYCFTCKLNSISMADQVHAELHYFDKDGEFTSLDTWASAEDYMKKFNEDDGEKIWNLIKSTNDYGYYMQQYLYEHAAGGWSWWDHQAMERSYRSNADFKLTKNLKKYKEALKAYEKVENFNSDVKKVNQTLTLDANTNLTLKVSLADDYNGSVSMKLDGKKVTPKKLDDGRYQVVVSGIPAHKLGDTHTLEITTKNGTSTYKVSALSYAYMCVIDPLDDSEIYAMCALYEYYKAALDYKS